MSRDFLPVSAVSHLRPPFPSLSSAHKPSTTSLVLASSSLASLQLVHVPSTNRHVSLVLVHAVCEALGRHGAVGILLLVGVVVALLLLSGDRGLGVRSLAGATAAKETANGVADGGADSDTSTLTHAR